MQFITKLTLLLIFQSMILFNFTGKSDMSNWRILDDGVMGGKSNGNFKLNSDGHGEYYGQISLKNNGGFSSLRYYFETKKTIEYSKFVLRIKGDGKAYQLRVKDNSYNRYSYIYTFKTTTDWQVVEIPFSEMYASFRGNRLDIPNFNGSQMEEIAFLIGNKKEEAFKILIDSIALQ